MASDKTSISAKTLPPASGQNDEPLFSAESWTMDESLEALKRLREKGLISEKAYERKSQQILEEL
jgi:hypothetical protein